MLQAEDIFGVSVLCKMILEYLYESDKFILRQVSKALSETVDSLVTSLKIHNLNYDVTALHSLCTKLQNVKVLNLAELCWSSNPDAFKALQPCTSIIDFQNVYLRCDAATKTFAELVQHQTKPIQRCCLHLYGGSKALKHILNKVDSLTSLELHIRDSPNLSLCVLNKVLRSCGPTLKTLSLEFQFRTSCTSTSCICNIHKVVNNILRYNTNLHTLYLDVPCVGHTIAKTSSQSLPLTSLTIKNALINYKWAAGFVRLPLENLTNLTLQDVVSPTFEESLMMLFLSESCPPLESLSWSNCWRARHSPIEPQLITAITSSRCAQTLQAFQLDGHFLSAQAVQMLPGLKAQLKKLSLSNARIASLPFDTLCTSVGKLSNLTHLDLSGLYLEQGMQHLFCQIKELKALQHINLTSSTIEPHSLVLFVKSNALILQSIVLEYCFSDEACLFQVLDNLPELPLLNTLNIVCYFPISNNTSLQYIRKLEYLLASMPSISQLLISTPVATYLPNFLMCLQKCKILQHLTLRIPVENDKRYDSVVGYTCSTVKSLLPNVKSAVW